MWKVIVRIAGRGWDCNIKKICWGLKMQGISEQRIQEELRVCCKFFSEGYNFCFWDILGKLSENALAWAGFGSLLLSSAVFLHTYFHGEIGMIKNIDVTRRWDKKKKKVLLLKEKENRFSNFYPTWGARGTWLLHVKGGLFNFSSWISQFQWESKG